MKKGIIVILIILVLGLGGFILYDKVLNDNSNNDTNDIDKDNNLKLSYKLKTIDDKQTCQVSIEGVFSYVLGNEENTEKELLRNDCETTLSILLNEKSTYFLKEPLLYNNDSKSVIYNIDLNNIEFGVKHDDIYNPNQSYYLSSNKNIFLVIENDIYEIDEDLNKISILSEKTNLNNFKVLGIVDNYAFVMDSNHMYAINLNNYQIYKSKETISYTEFLLSESVYIYKKDNLYYFATKENNIDTKLIYYFDKTNFNF